MRTPIIAGNWKMNKTVAEAVELVRALREATAAVEKVEMVVCPPFVSLTAVKDALAGSKIGLGAQNVFWEEKGAFTGEISAGDVEGSGHLRDHRPQRTPPVFWRNRCDREQARESGVEASA